MPSSPILRNFEAFTTGDFVSFEFLHEGKWKPGRISDDALQKLAGYHSPKSQAELFEEHSEAIAAAALRHPFNAERGQMILTSENV